VSYYSSKDVSYVLYYGIPLQAPLDTLSVKTSAVLREFKGLGQTWPTNIDTGIRRGELQTSGVYDGVYAPSFTNLGGSGLPVCVLHEGNTLGAHFYGFQSAIVESSEVGFAPDDVDTISATWAMRGEVNLGTIVAPLTARTTGANTDATYADLGADAATAICYLQITAIDAGGGNGVTVKVRDSNDHITFADAQAFTKTAAFGAETVNTTTLEQYVSISWEWDGGSNQTFTGFVGVATD
jgi:hypothetical protein